MRRSGEEDFRGARNDSEGSTRKNASGPDVEALVGKDHLEAARNHNLAEDQRRRAASGTRSKVGSIGGSHDNSLDQKHGTERREHDQEQPGQEVQPAGVRIQRGHAVASYPAGGERQRVGDGNRKVHIRPGTFIEAADPRHDAVGTFERQREARQVDRSIRIWVAIAIEPPWLLVPGIEGRPVDQARIDEEDDRFADLEQVQPL